VESLKSRPEVAQLAAQPLAAMQVLRVVEDPRACSADLARVIEADPALSARVMRLANSPYYGLSRRVGSASTAVVLLGFSAVRALAVSAAYGLIVDDSALGASGFWAHSVSAAIGASCVARISGGPRNEAFSAGLLHDIGVGLGASVEEHTDKGAAALEAWRFPEPFVEAVAQHHGPAFRSDAILVRLVRAGEALAVAIDPEWSTDGAILSVEDALEDCSVAGGRAPRLLIELQREGDRLARFLGGPG
jgi:putative nucleotidyltransferase with HDIG domain